MKQTTCSGLHSSNWLTYPWWKRGKNSGWVTHFQYHVTDRNCLQQMPRKCCGCGDVWSFGVKSWKVIFWGAHDKLLESFWGAKVMWNSGCQCGGRPFHAWSCGVWQATVDHVRIYDLFWFWPHTTRLLCTRAENMNLNAGLADDMTKTPGWNPSVSPNHLKSLVGRWYMIHDAKIIHHTMTKATSTGN